MASATGAHRFGVILLLACVVAGCRDHGDSHDVTIEWSLDPARPIAGGNTTAVFSVRRAGGQPLTGARLRLEAHMSHPGMTPITVDLAERGDGRYETTLAFTMAGDWVLVMTGTLDDGTRITRELEVGGVRAVD
jgi:hypothetical protein